MRWHREGPEKEESQVQADGNSKDEAKEKSTAEEGQKVGTTVDGTRETDRQVTKNRDTGHKLIPHVLSIKTGHSWLVIPYIIF